MVIKNNKGTIILNGNIPNPIEMISIFKDSFLNPKHTNNNVQDSKKVLLITAAMEKDEWGEFEQELRNGFHSIGIPIVQDKWGFDVNVQNLSIYNSFQELMKREYRLYKKYCYKQNMITGIKEVYRKNNISLLNDLWEKMEKIINYYPKITLFEMINAIQNKDSEININSFIISECAKVSDLMATIINNDKLVLKLFDDIENDFINNSGLLNYSLYQEQKHTLEDRIKSSSSIFITGGNPSVLNNKVRFYGLKEMFSDSLDNGSNFYGISSGSLLLTDRISYAFEKIGCPLEAYDKGIGLIENLILFPHADDYNYISSVHKNNLSFYALRHQGRICIGLNQYSFLKIEFSTNNSTGSINTSYSSVGDDPLIVFCKKGHRIELQKNNQLRTSFTKDPSDYENNYSCYNCEGYLECFG